MARIDDVRKICRSLARRGWGETFSRHGLKLDASDLEAELDRKLDIDRKQPGFQDFCLKGRRAIEANDPARSLLYHALASPDVRPTAKGEELAAGAYPSITELDTIENYIYSRKPYELPKRGGLIIGVFAYEYRPASSNAHGYHADLVFSRTGVARVGTEKAAWYGPWRSFRPDPPRRDGIAICPARYGAFIAEVVKQDTDLVPLIGRRNEQSDPIRVFYSPVHKLFGGGDCVEGVKIDLRFSEYHRNEKLRRLHAVGSIAVAPGFDINAAPFMRDSLNGGDLVALESSGASVLVTPGARPLVRTATQTNSVSGKSELVRFVVPPTGKGNRLETSLQMLAVQNARRVPEYVNIRHRVTRHGSKLVIDDLKHLPNPKFGNTIDAGGYEAAHFIDDTGDGCVCVTVRGLSRSTTSLPAYSLIAAPDFFPLADQLQISNWVRRNFINYQEHFAQGAPWPLCEGRRAANIELPRADNQADHAFSREDETVTAIVGHQPRSRRHMAADRYKRFVSFLTDSASNEFDPGWDVSLSGDDQGYYLAAYGLGSPFPEDAKLCAALNSFWPAAAPDAARTFNYGPTAMPLLDGELGYHPHHPLVLSKAVKSSLGWDGEQGPFFERVNGRRYVNAANIQRSDYVSNALADKIDIRKTSGVDGEELIRRMDALRRCITVLPPEDDWVSKTLLMLVTADRIENWEAVHGRAHSVNPGAGYRYAFAKLTGAGKSTEDLARDRYEVEDVYECQIYGDTIAVRENEGEWRAVSIARLDLRRGNEPLYPQPQN